MEISQDYIQSLLDSILLNPRYQKGYSNWVLSTLSIRPHTLYKMIIKQCSISIFCVFTLNSTQYLIMKFDRNLKISKLNSILPYCDFYFLPIKYIPLMQIFLQNNENLIKMNNIHEYLVDEVEINESNTRQQGKIGKRLKIDWGVDENRMVENSFLGINGAKSLNSVAVLGENLDWSAEISQCFEFGQINRIGN